MCGLVCGLPEKKFSTSCLFLCYKTLSLYKYRVAGNTTTCHTKFSAALPCLAAVAVVVFVVVVVAVAVAVVFVVAVAVAVVDVRFLGEQR